MNNRQIVLRPMWALSRVAICAVALEVGLFSAALAQTETQPSAASQTAAVDTEALRSNGQALIYAANPAERDVDGGIAMLVRAAEAGDINAKLSLGGVYLYGLVVPANLPLALDYFEQVASEGDGSGLAQYGMMMMWSEQDWASAEKTLVRAGEMGEGSAWATLAEGAMYGYLGGGSFSRAKFDAYAEKARAAGNARIEVLDATRQMWGISMPADGPATLAKLRAAADNGNADAARSLISLLRDGNGMNLRRDREAATKALNQYAPLLTEVEIWTYGTSIQAAKARDTAGYAEVAAEVMAHPERHTKLLGVELRNANLRAAIYVLQTRLAEKGLYTGPLDGLAGTGTLRAMYLHCQGMLNQSGCEDNVMRPDVVAALITLK